MKHLKMIAALSICSFLATASELTPKNDFSCSNREPNDSNNSLAKDIVTAAISKDLNSSNPTTTLEEYAKKSNLEGFAQALADGQEPSKERFIFSLHYDPTQKYPWIEERLNLQEFLTLSSTTSSAGLINFFTAEKMLKMLDIASTEEWSKLNEEDRLLKLMTEASKKDNKDKEGNCCISSKKDNKDKEGNCCI